MFSLPYCRLLNTFDYQTFEDRPRRYLSSFGFAMSQLPYCQLPNVLHYLTFEKWLRRYPNIFEFRTLPLLHGPLPNVFRLLYFRYLYQANFCSFFSIPSRGEERKFKVREKNLPSFKGSNKLSESNWKLRRNLKLTF